MKKGLIILTLLLISKVSISQDIRMNTGDGKFIIDDNLKLIVCNKNIADFNVSGISSLSIDLNGSIYEFSNVPSELEYGEQYTVTLSSQNYKLYFSNLPLININTSNTIVDEPKVSANFILTDATDAAAITSYCGIEIRGLVSQRYPKKSYAIELWEDETGDKDNKMSLLNMRDDDDWLLIAMYNEPLRVRNVMSYELWREIHTPYYINEEENAMPVIRTQYVELAVNNEYMGVYAFGERIDRKQLKLKKYKSSIRGELYKGLNHGGSTNFRALSPINNNLRIWSEFEMKYPKEDEITDWENLYNFTSFVVNSTDIDFEQNIESKFVLENAIDYFIFLNLLRAVDNTGKNIYIAKYKEGEPYFYVPWDLDGTFGSEWSHRGNIYNDILTNGLYDRLLDANRDIFVNKASNRWFELRSNVLGESKLKEDFAELYNFLLSNGNYERELLKWGQESIDFSNLQYTYKWLENRLSFLDNYFNLAGNNDDIPSNFITTWTVSESDKSITFPGANNYSIIGNYTINWGDENFESNRGNISHTYANAGTYTVTVSSRIDRFNLRSTDESNRLKLTSIEQWGTTKWTSMVDAFSGAKMMTYNATDIPDLSGVINIKNMFLDARKFNGDISGWNVSNINNMNFMFLRAYDFNQDISGWNVSSLSYLNNYFLSDARAFNQNLGPWFITQSEFTIRDDATAGSVVGTITPQSTLRTNQIHTYTISGGADRNKFSITSNGELTILEAPTKPSYSIEIKATGNLGKTLTNTKLVTIKDVGVLNNEDYFDIAGIYIWSNPTVGILNITVTEKADYRLLNVRGQVLKRGILVSGEKNKLDISSLSKGMYLLNIKTSKGNFTRKIIKVNKLE